MSYYLISNYRAYYNYRLKTDQYIELKDDLIRRLKTLYKISISSDKFDFNEEQFVFGINNNKISFKSLFSSDKPYLILKYSSTDCSACINEVVTILNEKRDSLNSYNIVFLSYYENLRDMLVENKSSFRNTFNSYLLPKNSLDIPIDNFNIPYFFILDKSKVIKYVFPIDISQKDMIYDYLKFIKTRID
jgi:hypothetical protein